MGTLANNMETDLTVDEVVYLITEVLECSFSEENMYTLPGEIIQGEIYEEYYLNEEEVMELAIDLFYE